MTPDEYNRRILSYFLKLENGLPKFEKEIEKNALNLKFDREVLKKMASTVEVIRSRSNLHEYLGQTCWSLSQYINECRKPPKMIPNPHWKGMRMDQDKTEINRLSDIFFNDAGVFGYSNAVVSPFIVNLRGFSASILREFKDYKGINDKALLLNEDQDEQIAKINFSGSKMVEYEKDAKCCESPNIVVSAESMLCVCCGAIIPSTKQLTMTYPELGKMEKKSPYKYVRIHWFDECIAKLQGHLVSYISADDWHDIYSELTRGLQDGSALTISDVNRTLKELKKNKLYKDSAAIFSAISGRPLPQIPIAALQTIRENILLPIENIFDEIKGDVVEGRKNFFSNTYLLYKMLELCQLNEVLPFISQLQGEDNLDRADMMWSEHCKTYGFIFYPSQTNI